MLCSNAHYSGKLNAQVSCRDRRRVKMAESSYFDTTDNVNIVRNYAWSIVTVYHGIL